VPEPDSVRLQLDLKDFPVAAKAALEGMATEKRLTVTALCRAALIDYALRTALYAPLREAETPPWA